MSTDDEIAMRMFLNMPLSMRVRDVKTTERFASDIQHYRPHDNDWPGIDEAGASPMRREWESTSGVLYHEPVPTERARDRRRVVGYVNWYGENIENVLYAEPKRTWALDSSTVRGYRMLDLLPDSLLYRSEPEDIPLNSPPTRKWYTSRAMAIVYNDVHYNVNDNRMKAVFPFVVTKPAPLLDMNDAINVRHVCADILGTAERFKNSPLEDEFRELERTVRRAFPINEANGAVGRRSNVGDDNAFCSFFDRQYPMLAGWIYMRSDDVMQHHDEIYFIRPEKYLQRAGFIVKEVREQMIRHTGNVDDDNDVNDIPLEDSVEEV